MHDEDFTDLSFYVIAHADDWQIFMNPNVYNDLVSHNNKVVFIITTAGDAGYRQMYWMAREDGSKSSIRYCLAPFFTLSESVGVQTFNDHNINYWSANHVTCYFLRLPDGNLDGNGFITYNNQSLFRLRMQHISNITAVDESATYNDWQDFYDTLEAIIQFENNSRYDVWINYLNPDTLMNKDDHNDHITTGQAIQKIKIISTVHQVLFTGYSIKYAHKNLPPAELFWKAGMLAAYEKAVYDGSGYSTLKEDPSIYLEWCLRCAECIVIKPET